jgi:hypothetical protein
MADDLDAFNLSESWLRLTTNQAPLHPGELISMGSEYRWTPLEIIRFHVPTPPYSHIDLVTVCLKSTFPPSREDWISRGDDFVALHLKITKSGQLMEFSIAPNTAPPGIGESLLLALPTNSSKALLVKTGWKTSCLTSFYPINNLAASHYKVIHLCYCNHTVKQE